MTFGQGKPRGGVAFIYLTESHLASRYGSTENVGTATRTWPWDYKAPGTVGPPQPNTEMKLVDVPTMGYTSEDKPRPRGEICLRSDACFKSYYKGAHYF